MKKEAKSGQRSGRCWIDSFLDYSSTVHSPKLFRKWAAIGTISAALQRKSHIKIRGQAIWPNMFLLLVARPGVGKTNALMKVKDLAVRVKAINFIADGITREKLFEDMEMKFRASLKVQSKEGGDDEERILDGQTVAVAYVDEFGVFCKRHDHDLMSTLAKLYDSPKVFDYRTKHHGEDHFENVCFSLLGGVTPAWMREGLTADVFEMGFPARIIMVHAVDNPPAMDLFATPPDAIALEKDLVHDLKAIARIRGEWQYDAKAKDLFRSWHADGMPPVQQDPRMATYNSRRILHINKIAMAVAAAKSNSLVIKAPLLQEAIDIMIEAEATMTDALSAVGENPMKGHMELAVMFVKNAYNSTGKMVPEHAVRTALADSVSPRDMALVLQELVSNHKFKCTGKEPKRQFKPYGATQSKIE